MKNACFRPFLDQFFTFDYGQGRKSWPPPYGQPDCKKYRFYHFPYSLPTCYVHEAQLYTAYRCVYFVHKFSKCSANDAKLHTAYSAFQDATNPSIVDSHFVQGHQEIPPKTRNQTKWLITAVRALVWNNGTLLVNSILTEISASRQDRRVLQKSKFIRIKFLSI